MMGSVATELTLEELVVVSESLEPYVLTYHPQSEEEGAIEVTVLVVLKREKGLLLALPPSALSQEVLARGKLGHAEDVFGPSAIVTVPGVILDGGNISATGTSFEVLLIDCLSEVVHSLREYRAFEEIIYGFEDGSSFSLPDPVEITSKALAWVETVSPVLERVGILCSGRRGGGDTPKHCATTTRRRCHSSSKKAWAAAQYSKRKAKEGNYSRPGDFNGRPVEGDPSPDHAGGAASAKATGVRAISINDCIFGPA